jgi:hypothetical protein
LTFLKERIKVEEEYSKSLEKLVTKSAQIPEKGFVQDLPFIKFSPKLIVASVQISSGTGPGFSLAFFSAVRFRPVFVPFSASLSQISEPIRQLQPIVYIMMEIPFNVLRNFICLTPPRNLLSWCRTLGTGWTAFKSFHENAYKQHSIVLTQLQTSVFQPLAALKKDQEKARDTVRLRLIFPP